MKKCQMCNCESSAKKCIKGGLIKNGIVNPEDFWHCDKHTCEEVNNIIEEKSMSIQMENPFVKAKWIYKP